MKRMLALLLIAFTFVSQASINVVAEDAQPEVQVARYVQIMNGGLVTVEDTFTLKAPQAKPVQVSSLDVGFFTAFSPERSSFLLWDGSGWQPLEYEEKAIDGPEFHGFDIILPSPTVLEGDSTLKIKASYSFSDLVGFEDEDRSALIPVYPTMTLNISSITFRAELPEGAELLGVDTQLDFTEAVDEDRWTLEHGAEALAPMRKDNATITYTPAPDDKHLLDCQMHRRSISIKQGGLRIEDTYTITIMGTGIRRFQLKLPLQASNIRARDSVGPLEIQLNTVEGEDGYAEAVISSRAQVAEGDRWTFTAEYSIPRPEHIQSQGGRFTLTYPAKGFPYHIQQLEVSFTLPEGGSFISSTPEPVSVGEPSAFTQQILLRFGEVMSYESPEAEVTYSRPFIWVFLRPLEWTLLVAVAVAGLYFLRRSRRGRKEGLTETGPSPLKNFLNTYRRRVTLLAEAEALERELDHREIGQERFEQRTVDITRRQLNLLQEVRRLEGQVEAYETGIQRALRELREAEAELEKAQTSMRDLEVRLRSRRVSRRDYRRRRSEYLRGRRRSIRRIEHALAALDRET